MPSRSWLFVPGDSERKLAKACDSEADVLILDLEDSVTPARKAVARGMVQAFLKAQPPGARKAMLYVRINPLSSEAALHDLAAVSPGRPDGIVQPKCIGPHDVSSLGRHFDRLEERDGAAPGSTKIVAIAGETAAGVLALGRYGVVARRLPRLAGLTWGPWDLALDLGAASNQDDKGDYTPPYRVAMSMTLFAAKAANVQAIDTVYTAFTDDAGLLAWSKRIRREGWTGKLAIHPAQVPVIHEGFRPTPEEVVQAQRVIAALTQTRDGAVSLDGVMIDRPHLVQAEYILSLRDA